MAKSVHSGRGKALAPATVEVLDNLVTLNAALEKARIKYGKGMLAKRPLGAITVKEFVAAYNADATKLGRALMGERTAEYELTRWVNEGEYQRAPMMLPDAQGRARRTYVYWETPK